jgi:hypothetical protein
VISTRVQAIATKAGVERLSELRANVYYVGQPNIGTVVGRLGRGWEWMSPRGSGHVRTLTRAFEIAQREAAALEAIVAKVEAMTDAEVRAAAVDMNRRYLLRQRAIAELTVRGIDQR